MLKNYFTTAWRNLMRNKAFSLINIAGLAIGISAALVICLIVQYDFSFDKFHKNGSRIYRLVSNFEFSGEAFHNSGITSPMGDALRRESTGLELVVPFYLGDDDVQVSVPGLSAVQPKIFKKEKHIVFVDDAYFTLIPYQWLAGNPRTALGKPYQVVLAASRAERYFPGIAFSDMPGRELFMNDSVRLRVSGIVADLPQNSDFSFTSFISRVTLANTSLKPGDWEEWNNTTSRSQLLVKLATGEQPPAIAQKALSIYDKYHRKDAEDNSKTSFGMQPLADIHFNPLYDNFDQRQGHKPTLYGLLAVAAFLLLLASINFINLTTAQASRRAKEIGIRKTMGSSRTQLVFQFLSETFVITCIAALLSITITPLLLKVFSDFIPEGLHFNLFHHPGLAGFLLALVVVVTFLSGFYPALVLSGYRPVLVLKNQVAARGNTTRSAFLRKSLTVAQFVIAQVFIIATLLVARQISFSLHKDLGFRKEAILYFSTNYRDTSIEKKQLLLQKLKSIPGISQISLSNSPPSSTNTWSSTMTFTNGSKKTESDVHIKVIDTNFLPLYKIKLLAGANLVYDDTTRSMMINETYCKILGFKRPADAIGQFVKWNDRQVPIGAVVADFHQKSLHEPIKPLALVANRKQVRTFNLALQAPSGNSWATTIAGIAKAWKEVYPDDDFEYKFLDESIARFYTSEQNISRLLAWATGLAIFISCMGLLGLVIFITNQRVKEIGIRKVVGASVTQLVTLLSKDFLKLIILAFVIAVPIAWWGAHTWIQSFAYRTNLSWWIFAVGGLFMIATAFCVLLIRTFRAASANPVQSLRTE